MTQVFLSTKTISTTAVKVADARHTRKNVFIQNNGTVNVFIATTSALCVANGASTFVLKPDNVIPEIYHTGEWWAICASGETTTVSTLDSVA